jgi:Holliday junction resolvase RusA-like endonuclease
LNEIFSNFDSQNDKLLLKSIATEKKLHVEKSKIGVKVKITSKCFPPQSYIEGRWTITADTDNAGKIDELIWFPKHPELDV